jgi:hypothetical protein
MRSTLITSVLAASVLSFGVAATAGAAESGDGGEVASPTTVPFNLDALGLTPEQMECLLGSASNPDLQDMTAMMDLMAQCGINPMDLTAGVTAPTLPGVPTTVFSAVPTVPGGPVDPAAAAAVLLMLGVDPTTAQCLADGLSAAISPGDDNEALAILKACGLTLNGLLTGIVAANAAAATSPLPTVPGLPTTVAGVPTTASGAAPGPIVQQLIDTVQAQYGITLTVEQATCLLDNITTLDPEDAEAMLALMEQCNISLDQLGG